MMRICIYCESKYIVKFGRRKTKERGRIQRYQCKECHGTFCDDEGFKWKHKSVKTILDALELFAIGNTLRFISQFLGIAKETVFRWFLEYARLLDKYVERFRQNFTDMLHMDELFLKMCGTFYYVWASICRDTRFATMILSRDRTKKYAYELLNESPSPLEVTTDGAFAYGGVIRRRFGHWWYRHNYHRCANFEDKKNNNLIERLNNTIRSLTHKRRGYRGIVTGRWELRFLEIYYNFIRRHMTIGMTPAEKAGLIEYYGCKNEESRLRYLIKQATQDAYSYLTLLINRICRQSQSLRYTIMSNN